MSKKPPKEVLEDIEAKALAHCEFHTPAQIANKVRHLVASTAPQEFEAAVRSAQECRRVNLYPEPNGMATIVALLPAPDAQTIMLAIDKLARLNREEFQVNSPSTETDTKALSTIDQFRADALTQLANTYLQSTPAEGMSHRRPITLNLTMDLPTLLGIAENPGHLAGYGAVPAAIARELAADGKWRRFITDPLSLSLIHI